MPAREVFRSSTFRPVKCSTSAVVAQLRKSWRQRSVKLRAAVATATISVSRGALAQLVRAPPCHGGGCGFEPRRLRIVSFVQRDAVDHCDLGLPCIRAASNDHCPAPTISRKSRPSHTEKSVRASCIMLQKPYRGSFISENPQKP